MCDVPTNVIDAFGGLDIFSFIMLTLLTTQFRWSDFYKSTIHYGLNFSSIYLKFSPASFKNPET